MFKRENGTCETMRASRRAGERESEDGIRSKIAKFRSGSFLSLSADTVEWISLFEVLAFMIRLV